MALPDFKIDKNFADLFNTRTVKLSKEKIYFISTPTKENHFYKMYSKFDKKFKLKEKEMKFKDNITIIPGFSKEDSYELKNCRIQEIECNLYETEIKLVCESARLFTKEMKKQTESIKNNCEITKKSIDEMRKVLRASLKNKFYPHRYDFQTVWIDELKKENKMEQNSYVFRGEVNFDHLINDCIKDQKYCFLGIQKDKAIIGISKQLPIKDKSAFVNQLTNSWEEEIQRAFYIINIDKSDISLAVKELTRISRLIKNRLNNTAKKLHKNSKKGKFSTKPETKVIVF